MRHSSIALALAAASVFGLLSAGVGCSSDSTPTPTDPAIDASAVHHPGSGTTEDSGPVADSGGDSGGSSKPATPDVVSVEPLAGGLHVTWKLNGTKLTGVELWRKKDSGTYAKAFSLPGTATSQHDEGAKAPGKYCYQVMTVRGDEMSEMSAEKCGTP